MTARVPNVTRYRGLVPTGIAAAVVALAAACAGAATATGGTGATSSITPAAPTDAAAGTTLIPPGLGTLRQDDVAVRVQLAGGVSVRAIPLEERVIRVLSPDSYRAMRELQQAKSAQLQQIARRFGYERYSVWLVSFFGSEQGEARFSPQEIVITNAGRDFRPLDLVPLTPGFGEQRLRQREAQSALYVFDGSLDVDQPQLTVTIETIPDASWGTVVLPRIERERALVRSRATRRPAPATPRP